jgi:hypothetical protein
VSPPSPGTSHPMHSHPMARLTSLSRERLILRHLDERHPLKDLAAEAGISLRTAYKWLARYLSGGHTSLADRRSAAPSGGRSVDPQQLRHAVDLRHQRCTLRSIAKSVGAPLPTVGRVMKELGLGRLRNLDPKPPVHRYQCEKPGDMIHVDTQPLWLLRSSSSWLVLSGSATASQVTAVKAVREESATRKFTSPWMTPRGWRMTRFCPVK